MKNSVILLKVKLAAAKLARSYGFMGKINSKVADTVGDTIVKQAETLTEKDIKAVLKTGKAVKKFIQSKDTIATFAILAKLGSAVADEIENNDDLKDLVKEFQNEVESIKEVI